MPPKKNDLSNALKAISHLGSFGLTMGAGILLGYWLGSYIDSKLGTSPWCMLVLVLLFMLGAFIKFLQETRAAGNKKSKKVK